MANSETPARSNSTLKLLIGFVVLMGIIQFVVPRIIGQTRNAGLDRGDIRLSDTVLPSRIGPWRCLSFSPPSSEGGQSGIIGWTHSWTLSKDDRSAFVAFDQIGFFGWHDLTQCYEATGWTVTDQKVETAKSESGDDWFYVTAELSRSNEKTLMLYSIFDGTGGLKEPPEISGYTPGANLSDEEKRCLQCQVMVPVTASLGPDELGSVKDLHFRTRDLFRKEWLRQKQTAEMPPASQRNKTR